MKNYLIISLILLQLLPTACDVGGGGNGDHDSPSLQVLSPTDITETGFQLNWILNTQIGYNSIAVAISEDEEMGQLSKYLETENIFAQSMEVNGLKGARTYYYTISLVDNGITIFTSEIKSVETAYGLKNIEIFTEDELKLSGKIAYLESMEGSRPGIILMHEFGVWVNPWPGSELLKQLVAEGYVCMTFFFRGHGTSDPVDDIMDLLNNRGLLAKDLQAAIDYMNEHPKVATGQLGLVGASMGAIMALAGNAYDEVLTSVALSPARDGVYLIFPDMTLSSVYYLAGELDIHEDPVVDFAAEAQALYQQSEEPKKLDIIPGTADHGSTLLSRDSLNTSIRDWILERNPLN